MENVKNILYAAKKYHLEQLKHDCDEFLTQNTNGDCRNIFYALELAMQYQLPRLTGKTLDCIALNSTEYLQSKEFTELPHASLKILLEYDKLHLEEFSIYKAALRWAETECGRQNLEISDINTRQVLGSLLYSIRFPLIDRNLFCDEVVDTDILIGPEKVDVFKHYLNKETESSLFSKKPRLVKLIAVSRFDGTICNKHMAISSGALCDTISFYVEKVVYFKGILMHSKNGGVTYTASLRNGSHTLSIVNGHKYRDSDPPIIELPFDETIRLVPGEVYNVLVEFGYGHIYGHYQTGKTTVSFGRNSVTFSNRPSVLSDSLDSGTIPGLLLST